MTTSEEVLRRLTIGDPAYCRAIMATNLGEPPRTLDARSAALLRLGGLIATGSAGPMWQQRVGEALDAGLSFDEIVGSLMVLAPSIGLERVVAVAPNLATGPRLRRRCRARAADGYVTTRRAGG